MGLSISLYLLEISKDLDFIFAVNKGILFHGYLGLRGTRYLETGGLLITGNFMTCIPHKILFVGASQEQSVGA
jgi:hypothetical protein